MPLQENKRNLYQSDFPPAEFASRRAVLFDRIGPDACALVQGAGPSGRSELFRQSNEFYYLCGIESPQAYLLLDGRTRTTTLFLRHRDERQERSEGPTLSAEDAADVIELSGVDAVRPSEEIESCLKSPVLYTPHSPAEGRATYRDEALHAQKLIAEDAWQAHTSREQRFISLLRKRYPGIEIRDVSPLLDEMRLYKSPAEIAVLRRAGRLTALAACEAMRCTRPGMFEYQLGAKAEYICRMNGAGGEGYRAIIASGDNIWFPHYGRNKSVLQEGDVVLFDWAPDFGYYTSDIGRTWPVAGRFTAQQRELYGFITRYHKELLRRLRPGVLPQQILDETALEMKAVIEATAFSKPIYEQAARRALEYKGHLSHPVGMAVHDVGKYWERPLQHGLVIAIDPQMWIPEEKLYVRVEDTVAVTKTGIENLTAMAPIELDAIEALVGNRSGSVTESGLLTRSW